MNCKSLLGAFFFMFGGLIAIAQGVPSSWNNEALIVLDHSMEHSHLLSNKGKTYVYKYSNTFKVKINKSSGLEAMQAFYVPNNVEMKITLTKEGGAEFEYDDRDASSLNAGEQAKPFFNQLFPNAVEFKKLVFDNLEQGDIIDFNCSLSEEKASKEINKNRDCAILASNNYVLAMNHPAAHRRITYNIAEEMHFNVANLNGAPMIDELGNISEEGEAAVNQFEFDAKEIDKQSGQQYISPMRAYPTVKAEVILCKKGNAEGSGLLAGNPGELKDAWSDDELKELVYNKYDIWTSEYKKDFKGFMTFASSVRTSKALDRNLEGYYRALQAFVYAINGIENFNDDAFMGIMISLFDELELNYEIVVGLNKETTDGEGMITNDDLKYAFRVKDARDEFVLYPLTKYGRWNDVDYRIAGTEAWVFKPSKKLEESSLEIIDLPSPSPAINQTVIRRNVTIDADFNMVNVNQKVQLKGSEKGDLGSKLVTDEEYNDAILSKPQLNEYSDKLVVGSAKSQDEERTAYFNNIIEKTFDSVKVDKFAADDPGVDDKSEWLSYSQKYRIPGLIRFDLQDSLYYFNVGALLKPMIEVTPGVYRKEDIDLKYPKIVDSRVVVKLNPGMNAFGADAFDREIDAGIATLKCKTKVADEKVIIMCSIIFTEAYAEASDWQKIQLIAKAEQEISQIEITITK